MFFLDESNAEIRNRVKPTQASKKINANHQFVYTKRHMLPVSFPQTAQPPAI
jgi:hypothetical protein